ncbi:hypothetical protein LB523_19790 [Mesorhizobium sp. ESP-6-4]|uniref:hypothetical protein n=1 Tax=Mesorhizobium sp. ESP-6-4 TaxID=2876624 RepID=UPI001CCBFB54|nr:hypothetical protein [Mesorhizobium sp. ESP-6-4]MBZ9661290.1 hypothetical protein [Mesorhizobium sp. ESP-6-4]
MRQRMLNGWLVAALVALVCLLGVTAYMEVSKGLPHVACMRDRTAAGKMAAQFKSCSTACCDSTAPSV